jgi:hypothetical protein
MLNLTVVKVRMLPIVTTSKMILQIFRMDPAHTKETINIPIPLIYLPNPKLAVMPHTHRQSLIEFSNPLRRMVIHNVRHPLLPPAAKQMSIEPIIKSSSSPLTFLLDLLRQETIPVLLDRRDN